MKSFRLHSSRSFFITFSGGKRTGGFFVLMNMKMKVLKESFTESELTDILLPKACIKAGDTICDPFAGVGTHGLVAASLGINTINIEIDLMRFENMQENFLSNRKKLKSKRNRLLFGDSESVIVGDPIDAIVTSPPFTLSQQNSEIKEEEYEIYIKKLGRIFKKFKPLLKSSGKIVVVFGDDFLAGRKIPLVKRLIQELEEIGYILVSNEQLPVTNRDIRLLVLENELINQKIIDLTKSIRNRQKVWPNFPPVIVKRFQKVRDGKGWNGTKLDLPVHELTHIDFPYHAFSQGLKSNDLPITYFIGGGMIVSDTENLPDIKFLIFDKNIPVTEEIVEKILRLKKVQFVGTEYDTLTPEGCGNGEVTHKRLLERNILIIENLTNLDQLPRGESFNIEALPLKINADGAPVRVIAKI